MDNWTRRVELDGCINLRDIGDYPTAEGRRTRRRFILRSDSLAKLPEASRRTLLQSGVHTIIDLRGEWELSKSPSPFAASSDVAYYNIPLLTVERPTWVPPSPHNLDDLYCLWLEHCGEQLSIIMGILAESVESRGGPVVVHCAGGKDRTGLVVALLLSLAGVQDQTIAEDYALTAIYAEPIMEELKRQAALLAPDENAARLWVESPPEAMLRTLDCLHEKYGGAESYLLSVGVSREQVDSLKKWVVGD